MPFPSIPRKILTVLAGSFCVTVYAHAGGTIYYDPPTVFSLTATNTQYLQPAVEVHMFDYTGLTLVYFSADAGVPDVGQWTVAFDSYNGSLTQRELSWPDGIVNISPYITLNPGWLPPGVTNVHQHWAGTIAHVYNYNETGTGGTVDIHEQIGAPLHFIANAAPTVALLPDANVLWHADQPAVLTAIGHDAEADLWNTVYLEYRWDFNSDGVWDTGWSRSNQITNTFSNPGVTKVTVQVIDRGYANNGWASDMSGETWRDTLTSYVLSASSSFQPPMLTIIPQASGLEIFWPTNEVPLRLLENATLDAAGWTASTNPVATLSGTNYVWLAFPSGTCFFRLTFP